MTKTKLKDKAFQNQIDKDKTFTCEKHFDPKYVEIGKCCMLFLELYNISLSMMSLIVLQAADFHEQQTLGSLSNHDDDGNRPQKFAYLTKKNSIFARFARAFFKF